MPVWDIYVSTNLGLKMNLGKSKEKIEQAIIL
jgi:hypothetical protein